MTTEEFVDYYELLQCDPEATWQSLENLFVEMAKLHHPDKPDGGDKEKFAEISAAFETLSNPERRQQYNEKRARFLESPNEDAANPEAEGSAGDDTENRQRMLELFYSRRRGNMKEPGIGAGGISERFPHMSMNEVEFHLWYLVEKDWLKREDGGSLAITAEGVERFETTRTENAERDQVIANQEAANQEAADQQAGDQGAAASQEPAG